MQKLSVVNKILAGQALIITLAIASFFMLGNEFSAKSAFYGGLVALIPNWYFARKINQHTGQEAKKIVRAFYAGESGKLILTAMLFALILQDQKIDMIAVLTTYISALTVFWFALLIRKY
ncbi:ATP synthase subunit I [Methyloprofundus sp.]|uniref:ATP synthase subunit I n=1 Tax=Methyloprofundus sp. TaxID=2020875 RepID=UPI003D0F6327